LSLCEVDEGHPTGLGIGMTDCFIS